MTIYTCPHHPEIQQDHPGTCPKCGSMKLVPKEEGAKGTEEKTWFQKYQPLFIIVGYILFVALLTSLHDGRIDWEMFIPHFMAGFFLVFSGFKFLDLPGFAKGYATYDLLAGQIYGYGYLYPFLELAVGIGYLMTPETTLLHIATLILMSFSGLGVIVALAKKKKFQCACLGTIIKVPLTTVTLVEDFGMALMALAMLLL